MAWMLMEIELLNHTINENVTVAIYLKANDMKISTVFIEAEA